MLAHQVLTARDARPSRYLLFLHGILGQGQNWRSIARRWVARRPGWGAVLVDLRLHGSSQDVPGPHTVEAAARDLDALVRELEQPVRGVLGHSFGGKVALRWLSERDDELEEAWIIDSPPGARPAGDDSEAAVAVLDALDGVPMPQPGRDAFVEQMRERGFSEPLGRWLAMNLVRNDEGSYALGLDLDAIREILDDYFQQDLWHVIETNEGPELHLVVGSRSEVFPETERARARRAAQAHERVHLHLVKGAGHWLHVEAPDALLDLMAPPDE